MKKNKKTKSKKNVVNKEKLKKIIGTILIIIFALAFLSLVDIALVVKGGTGPIFAIKTHEYENGSKEYYGLFYKVIKYQEEGGRYDTVLGSWGLKYEDTPIKIELFDFAVEYVDNNKNTYDAFLNKYVLLTEKLSLVDNKNKILRFEYVDSSSKYDFAMDVYLKDNNIDLSNYNVGDTITVVGVIKGFKDKDKTNPNRILIKNAFIK